MSEQNHIPDLIMIGEKIKERRRELGLTQEQLAERIGGDCSNKVISRYEKGRVRMGLQAFLDIADALHTTPGNLSPDRFCITGNIGTITSLYEDLTPENERMIEQMIRALLLQQQMPPA